MPFQIMRNDITRVAADAIVNTANPQPLVGGGTDRAIYEAAGCEALLAARREVGALSPGEVAATPAFALPARWIFHAVGLCWQGGTQGEEATMRRLWRNTLALAEEKGCACIAFPLMGAGVYGFPKEKALDIALSEIGRFLLTHEMQVILVVFDREAVAVSEQMLGEIDAYIDEHTVMALHDKEYQGAERARLRGEQPLDEVVAWAGAGFRERLFALIDASGLDDVTVYKRANIDRKVFSRIRCKPDYTPSKKTAVALAVALELDLPAMQDLLARAGMALSPNDRFDLIVSYFVAKGIYDSATINLALFRYGQPLLGE